MSGHFMSEPAVKSILFTHLHVRRTPMRALSTCRWVNETAKAPTLGLCFTALILARAARRLRMPSRMSYLPTSRSIMHGWRPTGSNVRSRLPTSRSIMHGWRPTGSNVRPRLLTLRVRCTPHGRTCRYVQIRERNQGYDRHSFHLTALPHVHGVVGQRVAVELEAVQPCGVRTQRRTQRNTATVYRQRRKTATEHNDGRRGHGGHSDGVQTATEQNDGRRGHGGHGDRGDGQRVSACLSGGA